MKPLTFPVLVMVLGKFIKADMSFRNMLSSQNVYQNSPKVWNNYMQSYLCKTMNNPLYHKNNIQHILFQQQSYSYFFVLHSKLVLQLEYHYQNITKATGRISTLGI